jgi:glycosyltransferase involved in cell wall biosynthesis
MRVLFIDQFSDAGGAQQCLLDSVRGALDRGWSASAAVPGGGPLVRMLASTGASVTSLPSGPYGRGSKSVIDLFRYASDQVRQTRTLTRLFEANRFDLVYVNGPRVLPAAVRAARGRLPVLFHAHNRLAQGYAVRLVGRSIKAGRVTVAACSRFVAEPLASWVAPPGQLHVIPNGVGEFPYRRRTFGPARLWRIGIVGRIAPEKGHEAFIAAAASARPHLPEGTKFVICGAPSIPNDAWYRRVRRNAAAPCFEFIGWRDDVSGVLNDLDLLVVPSRSEGMPRVILEAFSAGLPVIAFPAGGVAEVIQDGENGFLVPECSNERLAERIVELVSGAPERLQAAAAIARHLWEREYDVALYQRRITELMERMARVEAQETETPRQRAHTA